MRCGARAPGSCRLQYSGGDDNYMQSLPGGEAGVHHPQQGSFNAAHLQRGGADFSYSKYLGETAATHSTACNRRSAS